MVVDPLIFALLALVAPTLAVVLPFILARRNAELAAKVAAEKIPSEIAKAKAETDAVNEQTFGRMQTRLNEMGEKLLAEGEKRNQQTEKFNDQTEKLNDTIFRNKELSARVTALETDNATLRAELTSSHKLVEEQAAVILDQKRMLDGIPARMRLYDAALKQLGVELPPDPLFEAARVAVEAEARKDEAAAQAPSNIDDDKSAAAPAPTDKAVIAVKAMADAQAELDASKPPDKPTTEEK